VRPEEEVKLKNWPTTVKPFCTSKSQYQEHLEQHVEELSSRQQLHYASNRGAASRFPGVGGLSRVGHRQLPARAVKRLGKRNAIGSFGNVSLQGIRLRRHIFLRVVSQRHTLHGSAAVLKKFVASLVWERIACNTAKGVDNQENRPRKLWVWARTQMRNPSL